MSIEAHVPYAGGVIDVATRGVIGGYPLGGARPVQSYAPQPITQIYGEGIIDQKLKEIDEEIAKIHNSIDALRGVEVALCGAHPMAAQVTELKPRAVENGLADKLASRKIELASAADVLLGLVTRLQTL